MKIFDPRNNIYLEIVDLNSHCNEQTIIIKIESDNICELSEIYNIYGNIIYNDDRKNLNPIAENTKYFGASLNSFQDCLLCAPEFVGLDILAIHYGNFNIVKDFSDYIKTLEYCSRILSDRGIKFFDFILC